uniref:hypothetical protein n=1 Tax=Porphyromonas loveana TaxID=1884669 RepID=UPI00359FBBAC
LREKPVSIAQIAFFALRLRSVELSKACLFKMNPNNTSVLISFYAHKNNPTELHKLTRNGSSQTAFEENNL